jgi:uncharacterized peroxidase-related enzyme
MSWIKTINYENADSKLKSVYNRVKGPNNNIDNVLLIHSLRPHTLAGHMSLYKNVLHNAYNKLPKWYLEAIGVYVSHLNKCEYCVKHHYSGLKRLLNNDDQAENIYESFIDDSLEDYFNDKYLEGCRYAKKLTLYQYQITEKDIKAMRITGFSDGEILEINQVVSYFNYVNRTVLGLGVDIKGDLLGLSPNDCNDSDNWNHK